MKYDFQLLFALVAIGLLTNRLGWKGWFFVSLFVFAWMMYNWMMK